MTDNSVYNICDDYGCGGDYYDGYGTGYGSSSGSGYGRGNGNGRGNVNNNGGGKGNGNYIIGTNLVEGLLLMGKTHYQ